MRHGAPEYNRSDNGQEFIAYAIQDWLCDQGGKTLLDHAGMSMGSERSQNICLNDSLKGEAKSRD